MQLWFRFSSTQVRGCGVGGGILETRAPVPAAPRPRGRGLLPCVCLHSGVLVPATASVLRGNTAQRKRDFTVPLVRSPGLGVRGCFLIARGYR